MKRLIYLSTLILFYNISFAQISKKSVYGFGFGANLSKINIKNDLIETSLKPGFDLNLFYLKKISQTFSITSIAALSFNNYLLKDSQNEILLKNTKFSIPVSIECQPKKNLPLGIGLGYGIAFNKELNLNPILNEKLKALNYYLLTTVYYKILLKSITLRPQISYERTLNNLVHNPENAHKSTYNFGIVIY